MNLEPYEGQPYGAWMQPTGDKSSSGLQTKTSHQTLVSFKRLLPLVHSLLKDPLIGGLFVFISGARLVS